MNNKKKVYSGKTKDIYKQPNGNLLIVFKDDVTGENGVVDPGSNFVMGQIKGKGRISLEVTNHFFQILTNKNIPTHLVSIDLANNAMEAREALQPGKTVNPSAGGLEFVCRPKAYGSFLRRYQKYVREKLQDIDCLVEVTLKDDERGDPLINDDALVTLGLLTRAQLEKAKTYTRKITRIIEKDLRKKELTLVDIKMEFGLIDGEVVLIDEISADSMRVMDKSGKFLTHEDIHRRLLSASGSNARQSPSAQV